MIKIAKKESKEVFFVGIKDPIETRRGLLESSRDIVQSLQRFENFKVLRAEKEQRTRELVTVIRSTQRLVSRLKKSLPETKLRVKVMKEKQEQSKAKVKKGKKAKPQKEKKPEIKISRKELGEIDRLEQELNNIEQKLHNLN